MLHLKTSDSIFLAQHAGNGCADFSHPDCIAVNIYLPLPHRLTMTKASGLTSAQKAINLKVYMLLYGSKISPAKTDQANSIAMCCMYMVGNQAMPEACTVCISYESAP